MSTEARVLRHRTAMLRMAASRPIRLAHETGLITPETTVLDYGCGRGDDLRWLRSRGVPSSGWDPVFRPAARRSPADVVNLGYVVNVIEDAKERTETLREAFRLCRRLLIVSARLSFEARATRAEEFGDGLLTRRGTFQKFFAQDELRDWIDTILGARSVAAAPGIFIVFRDDTLRQAFQLARYRQRATAATERISDRLFEEHQDLLQPLMDFFAARGRLPEDEEIEEAGEIRSQFGSIRQAFLVVRHASGKQRWEEIQRERAEGFLVYLALERFGGRPRFSALPRELQLEA